VDTRRLTPSELVDLHQGALDQLYIHEIFGKTYLTSDPRTSKLVQAIKDLLDERDTFTGHRYCGGLLQAMDPACFDLSQEHYLRLMLDGKHPIKCSKCEYVSWIAVLDWKEVQAGQHCPDKAIRCDQILSDG
jgi:hypothetical protein